MGFFFIIFFIFIRIHKVLDLCLNLYVGLLFEILHLVRRITVGMQ